MINKYLDKKNFYYNYWSQLKDSDYPLNFNNLQIIYYKDFVKNFCSSTQNNKKYNLFKSLLNGDVYLLKNVIDKKFLNNLKSNIVNYYFKKGFNFYKMIDGIPNFANKIDEKNIKNYSVKMNKHVFYAFPFNEKKSKFRIFSEFYKYWSNFKYLSGYKKNQFSKFIPSNGLVDRIQVVRYSNDSGFLNPHRDPHYYQKFFINTYMSKKGIDYDEGGFYLLGKNNNKFDVEKEIEPGDVCFGFSTLAHGVDKIKTYKKISNNLFSGRWFVTMGTVVTDVLKKRHTSVDLS